jgi:hypothetical protein
MQELVLNSQVISNDGKEMISLTDLWKANGSIREQAPNFWVNQDSTQMFVEVLNATQNCIIKSKRGKNGGTWAHWQIALAYAKYLNPQFHIQCNQWIKERIEEDRNPELAIKRGRARAVKSWKKQGKTDKEIEERLKGIDMRNIFTSVLGSHEVKKTGFGDCTNAIYKYLFGGPAKKVKEKLGLPEKSNPRDFMNFEQLHAINIAEGLASNKIDEEGIYGNEKCAEACEIASRIAAKAIHEMRRAKLSKSLY